jgi:preprotein translocase subunit SecE
VIKKVKQFLKEARVELKKVSWPSRRELIESTMVVIVTVLAIAIFIGIIDLILSKLLAFLLK